MKKMTALLLASVMTVSLAACGGNDDDDAGFFRPRHADYGGREG